MTTDTQTYIDRAVQAIQQTQLTMQQQLDIEAAITSLAEEKNWSRQRAAVHIHCRAFPNSGGR